MRCHNALSRKVLDYLADGGLSLGMKMRLRFFQQGDDVRLNPSIGTHPKLAQRPEYHDGSETPHTQTLKPEWQFRSPRRRNNNIEGAPNFVDLGRKGTKVNSSHAGLSLAQLG